MRICATLPCFLGDPAIFRYSSAMSGKPKPQEREHQTTSSSSLAKLLTEKPQPLGIMPTGGFWYGETQAVKHFLGRKFFLLTILQMIPIIVAVSVIAYFASIPASVASPISIFLSAGLLEKISRNKLKKKIIAEGRLPGKSIKAPAT